MFTGRSDLIFTDGDGIEYMVNTETFSSGMHDMVLFSKRIKTIEGDKKLNKKERETIVSKILNLTPEIKWLIH